MPQMQFPFFPDGVTHITNELAFEKQNGRVTYFNGQMPLFIHDEADVQTFRMITAQFCINGTARQVDVARAFGVPLISIKRAVKLYRDLGPAGFFQKRRSRGAAVLTPQVIEDAQSLLYEGFSVSEVAKKLELKKDTLAKAIKSGRLKKSVLKKKVTENGDCLPVSNKSQRSAEDGTAPMGMGATNTLQRVAASIGNLGAAEPVFQTSLDVPFGGVLLALPALLAVGLLRYADKYFSLPKGYYGLESIFLLLACMALARLKTVETLRYCSPGEWGKLLGLDRIPEVRTIREKINILSLQGEPIQWSAELCKEWMGADPEGASVLYVDGHVRVYHGHQTKLPRHYVARQKLCLRATTDYWVNAMDGQPFFLINQAVDPGLIQVLENEIVPRLEGEVPNQPTKEALSNDPLLHRFTLVFDREGYSPEFFKKMKDSRIACLTYHKYPGEDWDEQEFRSCQVTLSSGNQVEMNLAERGSFIGGIIWVREIRKLNASGHQTSVLSTDYRSDLKILAVAMFARWSQENFFKYMRQHFNLDHLLDYSTESIPDTITVVNPEYRRLDGKVRSLNGVLNRKKAAFGSMNLPCEIQPKKMEAFEHKKAELQEEIEDIQSKLAKLKAERKSTRRHITIAELPEEERFDRLETQSKHLIDTVKMVAYRSETSMAQILREKMSRQNDGRSLLQGIYATEADVLPDEDAGTLTIRLHHLANRSTDKAISHLCNELNATKTVFPGTKLQMVYELVTSSSHDKTG